MPHVVVLNATMYDGCLERMCINKSLPCVSQTEKQPHFVTAAKLTKNHLMTLWKGNQGAMADKLPRYMPEPNAEILPSLPAEPSLTLCSLIDGALCLPRNIRAEFLTDAVRSPEWRKMLQEFDRTFGTEASAEQVAESAAESDAAAFDWASLFKDEPHEKDEFHRIFDGKVQGQFQWCPELIAYVIDAGDTKDAEHPKKFRLYVEAVEAYKLSAEEGFLTYGAGVWLLDQKAETFLAENPHGHKGVICAFKFDSDPVVLEARFWNNL